MTTRDWIDKAMTGEVWNIGQLDKATIHALDCLVKSGELVKSKEYWAGLTLKTVWRDAN